MAKKRYVKACDAFPPDLLEAVSSALGGRAAYIWVPSARTLNRIQRDRYILDKYAEGYSPEEIADEIFLSARSVYDVVAKERRKRRMAARHGEDGPSSDDAE